MIFYSVDARDKINVQLIQIIVITIINTINSNRMSVVLNGKIH